MAGKNVEDYLVKLREGQAMLIKSNRDYLKRIRERSSDGQVTSKKVTKFEVGNNVLLHRVYAQMHFYAISYANLHVEHVKANKKHTPFFPGPHTTTRQLAYLRHAIFQPYANRHIASHTASMSEIQYRNVAKSTSIRTRFKSLTSIEQAKLRILKKCSMMLMTKYRREKDAVLRRKVKRKILLCINLSVGIQMDTYEPIDRPVRMNISLENMTFMFSKEFLRF